MKSPSLRNILARSEIFASLNPKTLDEIVKIARYLILSKDTILIKEKSPADTLYLIVKGKLGVFRKASHKSPQPAELTTLKAGDIVGDMSFLDAKPRSASVVALTHCEVIAIPNNLLARVAPAQLYQKMASRFSTIIRKNNDALVDSLIIEVEKKRHLLNISRFITYILLLLAFYDLTLKGFMSLSDNPYTGMFASTFVIAFFAIVFLIMIKQMGYPYQKYGFTLHHWQIAVKESVLYSLVFIVIITLLKWAFIQTFATDEHLIDFTKIVPVAKVGSIAFLLWYFLGILVYSLFALIQEFMARGVLQSSLSDFLQGKHRFLLANLITSGIFSAMHIHLSAVFAWLVFIPSLFWGWLYIRHRTLLSPIISHLLIGCWAIFILGIQSFVA